MGRALSEDPDEIIVARVKQCAYWHSNLGEATQKLSAVYEKIDLPEITPIIKWIERYEASCPACARVTQAPVPQDMETGSPFGSRIESLALY